MQTTVVVKNGDNSALNEKLQEGWVYIDAIGIANNVHSAASSGGNCSFINKVEIKGDTVLLVILEKDVTTSKIGYTLPPPAEL